MGGHELTMQNLAGSLTKSASYRGTSFELQPGRAAYVVGRINAKVSPEVERAQEALESVTAATVGLIQLLQPRDFELLVDLIFTSSGWRRVTELGRTQKTLDLAVTLPSTGERAWIQVKSATDDRELASYAARLDELPYERLFFVYHTGYVHATATDRVVVIGPEDLARLVVDAGLTRWLVDKVS